MYKRQVRAGVVEARGRCCPAATVPVAVVLPCGVSSCIAENKQNTIINRKPELCHHHRPQTKAHSNEYETNTHKAEQALPVCRGAGRSSRGTKPLLSGSDGARSCRIRLRCSLLPYLYMNIQHIYVVCCKKKKETHLVLVRVPVQRTPPPMEKKKQEKKKRCRVSNSQTLTG